MCTWVFKLLSSKSLQAAQQRLTPPLPSRCADEPEAQAAARAEAAAGLAEVAAAACVAGAAGQQATIKLVDYCFK